MDIDELKDKYRKAPLGTRLAAMAVLGLLPAVYFYFEDSPILEASLGEAQGRETIERQNFEKALQTKADVPRLEQEKAYVEDEYARAKKSLPDSYKIEDVLERTATLAKETGATLRVFKPGIERTYTTPSRYAELPIATEVEGRFAQVAAFFDRVVHLESTIFVRSLELKRSESAPRASQPALEGLLNQAMAARQNVRVQANFNLHVYRGLKDGEANESLPGAPAAGKGAAP